MENKLIDVSVYGSVNSTTPNYDRDIWTMSAEEFKMYLDGCRERVVNINN